jgi:hypothetical protein
MCSNDAKMYSNKKRGYSKFCGKACQSLSDAERRIGSQHITKDFWYQARIVDKKTIKQICKETGLSEPLVTRYLRKFDLVSADERRPDNTTNEILVSSGKLYDLYHTKYLKVREIAELINSSSATVSRWLQYHNIDKRESNSYDRAIKTQSGGEKEVYDFIKSIYDGPIEQSNKQLLGTWEIDMYLPEKNFALEYNGLYVHCYKPHGKTPAYIKDKTYHVIKTNKCEEQDIQLFHLYEDEWKNKRPLVESMIRSRLGLNEHKIYARQCTIREIDLETKNTFLNQNHMQGQDSSSIKLGLYHNETLVAIMTFIKQKFGKDCDWELNRFATLSNHTVIGGFSKLLKYATNNHVSGVIISYADRRYSQGNVYEKNGFVLKRVSDPGYYYLPKACDKRLNRLQGTKQNLEKLGGVGNTEFEMATSIGWKRIYDCGVKTYVYTTDRKAIVATVPYKPITFTDKWVITTPGNEQIRIVNLTKFCREHSLDPSNMMSVSKCKAESHKGYKCEKL